MSDNEVRGPSTTQTHTTMTWTAADLPAPYGTLEVPVVDPRHYRIVREVARGGVGRILEAVDTRLQRDVALKRLIDPERGRARFIREALLTARLQHPAIVAVHEVGVFADGGPFIAMKLVRGESLRAAIHGRATLSERLELVPAVLAVAEAIAYAHDQGIIHRDLKPSNVLLGSFGEVVVIDWGLAKSTGSPDAFGEDGSEVGGDDATQLGAVIGTPAYMPPEQALGRAVDERADVYALGAMLYEVLVGAPPVVGQTAKEVIEIVLSKRPTPVVERVPGVPADLAFIVDKAMSFDAADRYRSAAELAAALRRVQLGRMLGAPRPDLERDPAVEAALADELRTRTADVLGLLAPFAVGAIASFGVIPWLRYGGFVGRDVWPRAVTVLGLAFIYGIHRLPAGRRWSQQLGMVLVLLLNIFFVAVNVLDHNAIGWYLSSTIAGFLGCMMLPLTSRRLLWVVAIVTTLSIVEGILSGLSVFGIQFILQISLTGCCALLAFMAGSNADRLLRAEFYGRYRLQRANELLARFDPKTSRR